MSFKVFTDDFVAVVAEEIKAQLQTKGTATRTTVCNALGIEGYEACITILFDSGKLPAYKSVQRLGIVSSEHKTGKEKAKEAKAKKEAAKKTAQLTEVSSSQESTPPPADTAQEPVASPVVETTAIVSVPQPGPLVVSSATV